MTNREVLRRPAWAEQDPLLTEYYDTEWGMPLVAEDELFEHLTLEGFQAGLSWLTVLRKREGFRAAFDGFDVDRVAAYDESDVRRLLQDSGIIRNRLKIRATISNAVAVQRLREEGGLAELFWSHMPQRSPAPEGDDAIPTTSPEAEALSKELKLRGFSYVGPKSIHAMMASIGIIDAHLVGSHRRGCSGLWTRDGELAPGVVRGAVPSTDSRNPGCSQPVG